MGLVRRLQTYYWHFNTAFPEVPAHQAIFYAIRARSPDQGRLWVNFKGRRILIRPYTPDIWAARAAFKGELQSAIDAARPLKYGAIVDAGAYIGTHSIALAEAFPMAKVIALEPDPSNYQSLCRNTTAHPNITTKREALGGTERLATLYDGGLQEWGYSLLRNKGGAAERARAISVTTIPALMISENFEGIDILKLDIEGSELEVLANAPWLDRVRVLIVELHDRFYPGCTEVFEKATEGRIAMEPAGEKMISLATPSASI